MRRTVGCCIILVVSSFQAQAGELSEIFPPRLMKDVASLKLEVSPARPRPSTLEPGRSLHLLKVSFLSFQWAGEQWRHQAMVLLPDRRPQEYQGAGAIVSGAGSAARKLAEAAALMGIPVLMITGGNPGPHYGYPREGELMGYGAKQFLETGDPHWIGYAWLGKVIVRAVTAATAIPAPASSRSGCGAPLTHGAPI